MSEFLEDYPVVAEIPVAWGEMDFFNHVNNMYYFRCFEGARIAYLEKIRIQYLHDPQEVLFFISCILFILSKK